MVPGQKIGWLLVLSISILFSLASQPIADHRSASVRADFALNASNLQCWPSESKFQIAPAFNPIDPFVMIKSVCMFMVYSAYIVITDNIR